MRLLKFRAWDKVKKEWVFHTNETPFHIIGEVTVFDMLGQYRIENFNDIEITEWTGLKDKNGNDIFEGDIITFKTYHGCNVEKVEFANGAFICGKHFGSSTRPSPRLIPKNCEIIGNIYKNPELLK